MRINRWLWVIESTRVDGQIGPLDTDRPDEDTLVFVRREDAEHAASGYRHQDKMAGVDTQIRVTKYAATLVRGEQQNTKRTTK